MCALVTQSVWISVLNWLVLKSLSIWHHCCLPQRSESPAYPQLDIHTTNDPSSVSPAFSRKTNRPPTFRFSLSGCGSPASTGLLVEVLREQGKHCLNYSKTQLPSAPRSKAADYQQPAVMRPQWLEIARMAWYTLPQPQHRYERLRWNTLRKTTVI